MTPRSVLRVSALALPCIAAWVLAACQIGSPDPSPVSPTQVAGSASGPAGALPGPAAVPLSEAEYGRLAKPAQSAAITCTIGLNDVWGLIVLPDQARYTFAYSPWYLQGCGDGAVHVLENPSSRNGPEFGSDYGHYHLAYQRGDFCLTGTGKAGIMTGGVCVEVTQPEREDRYLGSHAPDHWIRLFVYDPGIPPRDLTFSLKGIRVREGSDIRMYIRKAAGGWYRWDRLHPARWNVNGGGAIREVLISAAAGETGPFFLDDFVVSIP